MSSMQSLREASLHSLSLFFGALGGVLGLLVMAITEGWLSFGVGIGLGLYVALLLAYHPVRSHRDALALQADVKARDQAIVDALLPRAQFAIHELSNRVKHMTSDEDARKLKDSWRNWEHETKAALEKPGCTDAQVSSFWDLSEAEVLKYGKQHGPFHPNEFLNNRITWMEVRTERLKRIINGYSEQAVFFFD